MLEKIHKEIRKIVTDDLRLYLTDYQTENNSSKIIKETYTDEELEKLRDNCVEERDLVIIDMLVSTEMRIGEMVLLNRKDVNFQERECIVFEKGSKERIVYFDARTKLHLLD